MGKEEIKLLGGFARAILKHIGFSYTYIDRTGYATITNLPDNRMITFNFLEGCVRVCVLQRKREVSRWPGNPPRYGHAPFVVSHVREFIYGDPSFDPDNMRKEIRKLVNLRDPA